MMDESQNPGVNKNRFHVGTVTDNNDPKKWGRIRARVEGMLDGISDEHLPWAIVSLAHPGGATAQHGRFEVPEVGAKVLVEFQDGSPMHPVYKGYFIDETTKLPEADVNYPNRSVMLWPSGSMIILDKTSEDIFIRNQGDLHFYVTGDAWIKVDGNLVEHVKGNRTTFVDGNDTLVVGGDAHKHAANIVDKAAGNLNTEAGGTHQIYAGGTSHRDAGGQIHDDGGGGPSGASAPPAPTFPAWEGVRGKTPAG